MAEEEQTTSQPEATPAVTPETEAPKAEEKKSPAKTPSVATPDNTKKTYFFPEGPFSVEAESLEDAVQLFREHQQKGADA